jgi:hypothetical protein
MLLKHISNDGPHHVDFRNNLETDIKNIVSDKTALGIINYTLPANFSLNNMNIELVFVFEPNRASDIPQYNNIFNAQKNRSKGVSKQYQTIFVDTNDYKLK